MHPLIVVVACQALFTTGDLLARSRLRTLGFTPQAFTSWWFLGYLGLRTLATFGQLYVLSRVFVTRTMPMFTATSVLMTVTLGALILGEKLTLGGVLGICCAVAAVLLLTFR